MTTQEAKLDKIIDLLIDQGREVAAIRASIERLRWLHPETFEELEERVRVLESASR